MCLRNRRLTTLCYDTHNKKRHKKRHKKLVVSYTRRLLFARSIFDLLAAVERRESPVARSGREAGVACHLPRPLPAPRGRAWAREGNVPDSSMPPAPAVEQVTPFNEGVGGVECT